LYTARTTSAGRAGGPESNGSGGRFSCGCGPNPADRGGSTIAGPAAAAPQLGLFAPPPTAAQALNRALDAIADRFGDGSVTTADVADDRE